MRWLVEVTPMGKADTQSFCVEADSWQKALDAVRKHRGETPGMNGFSVELLEAGYRAVDPMARLKYVVRNAPVEMPLTPGLGGPAPAPAIPKDIPSDAKTVPALDADDSGPRAAQPGGKGSKKTSVKPPKAAASQSKAAQAAVTAPAIPSNVPRPPAPSNPGVLQMAKPVQRQVMIGAQGAVAEEVRTAQGADPRLDPKTDPPAAAASQAPVPPPPPAAMPIPAALSSTSLMADASDPAIEIEIVRSEPPAKMAQTLANLNGQTERESAPPPSSSGAEMIVTLTRSDPPAPPAQAGLPAIGSPLPGLPNVEIISHREQEPDAKSPIVYREISFALPPGTPDALAERVLTGQLEIVKKHIERYTSRKFVNLAAFDVKFTGKPPVPPLVTITWKDWAGAPVIGYPRQGKKPSIVPPQSAQSTQPKVASVPPPAFPAPAPQIAPHDVAPITQPMSNAPRPAPQTEPMLIAAAPSGELPVAAPLQAVPQVPAPVPVPVPPPAAASPTATAPMQQVSAPVSAPVPVPAQAPVQASRSTAPMHHADPFQADPFKAPAQQPAQAPAQASQPPSQSPSQPPSQSPSGSQRSNPPTGRHSRPSSPRFGAATPGQMRPSGKLPVAGQRGRVSGDDLISALFEAMHDLHFLRDSLEGGDFCLALANEMMPCRVGLVHAYDINKRNFVVACAAGPGAEGLLTKRVADQDALLNSALRKRKSVVLQDAAKAGAPGLPRYQVIGGAKSIIVTPIMFGARALAVLELVDPMDGNPFTEDEGHAMNYIAEQFAEFIGSHGLVLETDKILAHHAQNAQQPGHHP